MQHLIGKCVKIGRSEYVFRVCLSFAQAGRKVHDRAVFSATVGQAAVHDTVVEKDDVADLPCELDTRSLAVVRGARAAENLPSP